MSLGSRHKNKQMKVDVMNNDIESHSEMKLLGVTIDEHLNFSTSGILERYVKTHLGSLEF